MTGDFPNDRFDRQLASLHLHGASTRRPRLHSAPPESLMISVDRQAEQMVFDC